MTDRIDRLYQAQARRRRWERTGDPQDEPAEVDSLRDAEPDYEAEAAAALARAESEIARLLESGDPIDDIDDDDRPF